MHQNTYLDVNGLSCTGRPHKQTGLSMLDQHIHEVCVPYSINCWNNNGVERNVFRNRRNIFEFVRPKHPWPRIFFEEAIIVDLPIFRKGNWEGFGGGITALVEMVLSSVGNTQSMNDFQFVCCISHFVSGSSGPAVISLSKRLNAFLPSVAVLAPIDQTRANK